MQTHVKGHPKGLAYKVTEFPKLHSQFKLWKPVTAPEPRVCLGRHCLIQYLQLRVPSFRLTNSVFSVTLFSDITLNFWLDLCLQTDSPMALMLLTGFDHLHQLRNWLLFYGFFFPSESWSPD